jgi:hypothetical protein
MATVTPLSGFGGAGTQTGAQTGVLFPLTASATITGGQVVAVSGSGTVAPAGAASAAVIGYAIDDAASGTNTFVLTRGPVSQSTASGGITAGAQVVSAASGAVATIGANTFEKILGTALDTVTTGQPIRWVMC